MTQTTFVKDERVEKWLTRNGVTFSGPGAVRLSDIDVRMSRNNQARDVALDGETVESYRIAIRNGEELPAIIMIKKGTKYSIVDGNNRQEAARLEGKTRLLSYILDPATDAETLTLLTLSANATNGKSVSKDWKLHQSRTLIAQGYTIDAVAASLQIPVSGIASYLKSIESSARARRLRVQGWDTLSKGTREIVARIKLDTVFQVVAEIAVSSKTIVTPELKILVQNLNRLGTVEEQMEVARQWGTMELANARALVARGRVRRTHNPKQGIMTGIGKVVAFDINQVHLAFAQPEERAALSDKVKEALKMLLAIEYKLHDANDVEDSVMGMLTELGA